MEQQLAQEVITAVVLVIVVTAIFVGFIDYVILKPLTTKPRNKKPEKSPKKKAIKEKITLLPAAEKKPLTFKKTFIQFIEGINKDHYFLEEGSPLLGKYDMDAPYEEVLEQIFEKLKIIENGKLCTCPPKVIAEDDPTDSQST